MQTIALVMLLLSTLLLSTLLLSTAGGMAANREADRVKESGTVLKEILGMPDNIPAELLNRARCVLVLPSVKKLAIGIGGSYGRGVMTCRTGKKFTGGWSAPAMYALEGANIGFQLGGQATDFLILVINDRGVDSLLGSKVKLGADAAAAAGPVGRDAAAATDVVMRSEMLSYSRSRGLFAGISLEGSTLRPDGSATEKLYGRKLSAKQILREGKAGIPASAALLVSTLNGATHARVAKKRK
jgi:lipid-binding SYLF domain-containing protein